MSTGINFTPEYFNEFGLGHLPGYMGIVVRHVGPRVLEAELAVAKHLLAPNGYLHAGSVVTLADTAAGSGCIANFPENASSVKREQFPPMPDCGPGATRQHGQNVIHRDA